VPTFVFFIALLCHAGHRLRLRRRQRRALGNPAAALAPSATTWSTANSSPAWPPSRSSSSHHRRGRRNGVLQLGILPDIEEVLRLVVWVVLAVVYVGLWLALALLCSVVFKRAATSALVAIGVWLALTLFASLLVGVVAGIPPVGDGTTGRIASYDAANLARIAQPALHRRPGRRWPSVQRST
jgi:hypothetical protein